MPMFKQIIMSKVGRVTCALIVVFTMFPKAVTVYGSLLLGILHANAVEQHVFGSESMPTLRRFSVNSDDELRRLLGAAQVCSKISFVVQPIIH